jgi:hypothetical protein
VADKLDTTSDINTSGDIDVGGDLSVDGFLNHGVISELTISTGVVTATQTYHSIDTESNAATDDLDTINGGSQGDRIILRPADTSRTVVVKDGTGNLLINGDFSMDSNQDNIELICGGSFWFELSRSNNGA